MNNFRILAIAITSAAALSASADAAKGYYSSCEGKTGRALLQQLEDVVGPHKNVGYDGLWAVYRTSDAYPEDGTIWDMYSTKHWKFGSAQCGNYKNVGDCYNREHSMPKSWFSEAQPMKSDAFHVYPTDGKVNGQRSNFPYGECSGGTTLPANGSVKALGRLGNSTFPGYSGKVFEPVDEYKGDFARTYFYMAAAYNSRISSWSSPMLAGNSYPAYTTWAVNLLLKWHRQDPVSEKERNRNDAVEKHQNNRNPFIDNPEMAEYIWGDKQGLPWHEGAAGQAAILLPAPGAAADLGVTAVGVPRSATIDLRGAGLTENVTASVAGNGFSVSPASVAADAANAGTRLTVTFTPSAPGNYTGTLSLRSGDATASVSLSASAVDGLPAPRVAELTENSLVLAWSDIDIPGTQYTLNIIRTDSQDPVQGYPRSVNAADERAEVEGLEPETSYTLWIASPTLVSDRITVTTPAPAPSVGILYDGEWFFRSNPGVPSSPAELLADIENIPGDVTFSVTAPFELSKDKAQWTSSVTLAPGEERFYLRLNSPLEGEYSSSILITANGYRDDNYSVEGVVSAAAATFVEDFEPKPSASTYGKITYEGSACTWDMEGVYIATSGDPCHTGSQAARLNKANNTRHMTMLQNKTRGIGSVAFWGRVWSDDTNDVTIAVSVSSDGGATWTEAGRVDILHTTPSNEYREYRLPVNLAGDQGRVKLEAVAGGRCMIDDLSITDYDPASIDERLADSTAEYHTWDAYARDGHLTIENESPADNLFSVYAIDGALLFSGHLPAGTTTLPASLTGRGLLIVSVRDFARRVLLR